MAEVPPEAVPLSTAQLKYTPIETCTAGPGVNLAVGVGSLYAGCQCVGECSEADCTCTFPYSLPNGCLKEVYLTNTSAPIFECNSSCKCSSNCPNRMTQKRSMIKLKVEKTDKKGYGVFAGKNIPAGTFIGEYVGEIVSTSRAKKCLEALSEEDPCYIVTYREHTPNGRVLVTNVDATLKGNIMRFVNHSCSPNLVMLPVRVDSIIPRLCFFTSRDVGTEELCFSYFGQRGSQATARGEVKHGRKPCFCGSKECIGFLPLEPL